MAQVIQGFLLGLANGGTCLSACAPVFLPYLVGEGSSIRRNIPPVLYFLCGRLAGYLGFAVFAWEAGRWIRSSPRGGLVFGAIYAGLACLLVLYGFSPQSNACAAKGIPDRFLSFARPWPVILPALMGLLTGLSLCPPFITALAGATSQNSLASSMLFFASFFIATSLYLVPLPFAGLLGRSAAIRTASRMAAGLMGCHLFYQSLIMLYGGLRS
jgi:hypothetical protein